MIRLIINPTFNCGFDCIFCYTKNEQNKYDKMLLDIDNISEVFKNYDIKEVCISGGEPTTCNIDYMILLIRKINENYTGTIDFETNFHNPNYCESLQKIFDNVNIVVSYDFAARPYANEVWNNMYVYPNKFDVKITATHLVIKNYHPNLILKKFSLLRNINSYEIVRYMKNFGNQWNIETELFEKFIKLFNDSQINCSAKFKNKEKVLNNTYLYRNLFLNPDGLLTVQKTGTIVENTPFTGEIPALEEQFQTYTTNLVNYFKG